MSGACEWFELVQYVESFDMGINFLEGPPGPPGPAGEAIFIPSVSADGVLSWTNTAGLPNPDPIDLSGPAGTTDYRDLTNKPSINGVTLSGNKTTADLLIGFTAADVGLGNVANERQYSAQNPPPYPVTSVNGQTGAVDLPAVEYTIDSAAITTTHTIKAVCVARIGRIYIANVTVQVTTDVRAWGTIFTLNNVTLPESQYFYGDLNGGAVGAEFYVGRSGDVSCTTALQNGATIKIAIPLVLN